MEYEKADLVLIRGHLSHATDAICALPDHILALAWQRFSNIQQAEWLEVTKECADRFEAWFDSGDDADAWA